MDMSWDSRCKVWWRCVVATLLLGSSSRLPATLAQSHSDSFLNIDCGATDTYIDPITGYTWVPDTAYISTGKLNNPVVPTSLKNYTELNGLRYFDDLRPKNCFTLPTVSGSTYLLRAMFFYGNYDNKNQAPSFQIALDANVMDNATAVTGNDANFVEYHYVALGNETLLCLLRTSPEQTPFISGISLKPASGMTKGYGKTYADYLQQGRVMKTTLRVNYGETKVIRAPDDYYDRFWFPESPSVNVLLLPTTGSKQFLSTDSPFPDLVLQDNSPPSAVMQTAVTSNGSLSSLLFYKGSSTTDTSWYVSVYFGEVVKPVAGALAPRNFTIDVLGGSFPVNLEGTFLVEFGQNIYNLNYRPDTTNATMTMTPITGTLRGPILNAMEVKAVSGPRMAKTSERDALAIEDIKTNLNLTEWTGDPCLPTPHSWIGCILPDVITPAPQISSVNLSGYQLEGSIPPSFANLLALTSLSLANNNLSGQLPDFLATFKSLKTLSIQNNNFSGSIPKALLATNSPIVFTYRPGNPLLVDVASIESSKKSSNMGAIVGATIGGILAVLLILGIVICACRRCKGKAPRSHSDDEGTRMMKIANPGGAKAYSRAQVEAATNHFNRELGRGGFGPVFYGVLPDGQEVAVKVADGSSKQGKKEFFNEVDVLSRVHHRNLVALVGYCQDQDSILIYEYMSNGSLFDHLHGTAAGKGSSLNWKMRLHIGLNAAQGLEYLHTGCSPSFIHRDVKSSNILLTPKFDAKVADFGLARLMGETEGTRVMTTVMGTAGYLDPEYYTTQSIHTKSDVYSFGIVLLELLTGRLPIDQSMTAVGKNPHIAHWFRESFLSNMDSVLAPAVKASLPNMEAVWKVADIAMQSVEPKATLRPSMTEVVQELQGALALEGGPIVVPEIHSGYSHKSSTAEMGPSSLPRAR